MFDLTSPFAPFLIVTYAIGIFNTYQGLYFIYKFFDGYGALSPWQVSNANSSKEKKQLMPASYILIPPNKATKSQKYILLLQAALYFLSVFIIWQIAQQYN